MKRSTIIKAGHEEGHIEYLDKFKHAMEQSSLHVTAQRLAVASTLYLSQNHPTINDLYMHLRKEFPALGLATVYRTVNLLCEAGLAMELHGDEGSVRFEAVLSPQHHDHFICRSCGQIIEINSPELEKTHFELAKKYGFYVEEQAHCVYGLCWACRAQESGQKVG